jgi:putative transposase
LLRLFSLETSQGLHDIFIPQQQFGWINEQDGTPKRKVWFQYWESHITFHRSYLARLNYVYQNPVKHGIVRVASDYPWCSAGWFERKANRAFFRTVMNFPCDRIDIPDDFEV